MSLINVIKSDKDGENKYLAPLEFVSDLRYKGWTKTCVYIILIYFDEMDYPFDKIMDDLRENFDLNIDNFDRKNQELIFKLLEELTIVGYYSSDIDNKDISIICDYLFMLKIVKLNNRKQLRSNSKFFVHKLEEIIDGSVDKCDILIDLPKVNIYDPDSKTSKPGTYKPMNPSIMVNDDRSYIINVRCVNFMSDNGKTNSYRSMEEDGIIKTKNILCYFSKDFKKNNQSELDESKEIPWKKNGAKVHGFEDCRMIRHSNDTIIFTCTSYESRANYRPGVMGGIIKYNIEENSYKLDHVIPLQSFQAFAEKNWLPYKYDEDTNEIDFIYNYEPTSNRRGNLNTGNVEILNNNNTRYHYNDWRGSDGPIDIVFNEENCKMVIIHEVIWEKDTRRNYLHRFVVFDKNFEVCGISPVFYFEKLGIEFCSTMVCNKYDDTDYVIIGAGIGDASAKIFKSKLSDVLQIIMPLTENIGPNEEYL